MKVQADSVFEFEKQPALLLSAFRLMVINKTFLREFYPILKPEHWGEMELRWICAKCVEYWEHYQKAPKIQSLRMLLDADKQDEEAKKLILRIINKLDEFVLTEEAQQVVEDNFENFIRYRATLHAIREAQEFMEGEDWDAAVQVVQDSQTLRRYNDEWLTLPDDADKFFDFFDPAELALATVPIGLPPLDAKLQGGGRKGEIGIIVAPLGYGKSQFLVHIGSEAIRRGFNVVHFSFENSAEETLARYMYNLLHINSEKLIKYNVSTPEYQAAKADMVRYGSQLKIKRLTGSTTTCIDLSSLLSRLEDVDYKPSVVIVDYGDLMAAGRRSSHQSKKYEELQTVFEELRDLAVKHNVVLWTASQANREGMKGKRVLTHHIADALGKAFIADIVISMSKEQKDKEGRSADAPTTEDPEEDEDAPDNGIRILHLLKLRRWGSDNWHVKAKTRYAQARLICEDWSEVNDEDIAVPAYEYGRSKRKAVDDDDDAPEAGSD